MSENETFEQLKLAVQAQQRQIEALLEHVTKPTPVVHKSGIEAVIEALHAGTLPENIICDPEDRDRIVAHKWYHDTTYNSLSTRINGETITLGRFIVGLKRGESARVEYKNGNQRDVRKANLNIKPMNHGPVFVRMNGGGKWAVVLRLRGAERRTNFDDETSARDFADRLRRLVE